MYFYTFHFILSALLMSYHQYTLKDIAKELNTSISTVSRALNNHDRISEEMRKKVKALAKQVNYHPNPNALSLLQSRTYTIGVIVPEIAHSIYSIVMEGIEDAAQEAGYNVLFCMSKESAEREKNVLDTLIRNRVDGLLIAISKETEAYDHLESLFNREIPIVFFDRHCPDIPASKVLVDDYHGAYKAVEHLAAIGCKKIAHIAGPQKLSNSIERLNGYIDALRALHLVIEKNLILTCDLSQKSVQACTQQLIDQEERPDAIFTYNSFIAFESMLYVKQKGLQIPDDIAFVGFANEPAISYIEPSLTTIEQPAYRIGREAVKLFCNQIENSSGRFKAETLRLDAELVIKASTQKK